MQSPQAPRPVSSSSEADGTAARRAALEILRRVRAGQLFDRAFETAVTRLGPSDRRLAHEIAAGVLRHRTALDRRLRPLVSGSWRRTPSDIKDLLRIGAFQLTALDRVPPYGAVHATVEVAKRERGAGGAGLVNAVLRRVAAGSTETARAEHLSPVERLAEEYSHPAWPVERWLRNYGAERTGALLTFNNTRPRLVVQPVGTSLTELEAAFAQQGVTFGRAPLGAGLIVEGKAEELPGYAAGAFIVQDAAQAWLLERMNVPPGSTVWDACASPGGKTALLSRSGRVVASDSKRHRLPRLRDTVSRAAPGAVVMLADVRHPPLDPAMLDVVVLDAPCTATGTLARHPDARWRLSPERLARAVRIQRALLDGAAVAVRPGGMFIYLTCSLEPEENALQIDAFLDRHPMFSRTQDDLFVFPPDAATDGGFAAKLSRIR